MMARNSGLSVTDVRPGLQMGELAKLMAQTRPEIVEAMRNMRKNMEIVPDAFVTLSDELTDGTVDFALGWRPDLIVHSPMQGGALVAAGVLDVPAVSLGFGFARSGQLQPVMFARMRETFGLYGVEAVPRLTGNIDIAPPSMLSDPPQGWSMRPMPYNGGAVLPPWLLERPRRPRIGVTLGTVSARMGGIGPVRQLVETAERVDAEFVLALGDTDLGELGELPPNVRDAGWVPWDALCASSSAVIHHGGAGTTLAALDAAVPQLVLPDGADRYINADALAARGAGLVAGPGEMDPPLIDRLLHEDGLRSNSAEVSTELKAMPKPADLVAALTEFTAA
jgi:hypothetical protein